MSLKDKLGKEFIFFDGAMGTMLQKAGLGQGELPESYNLTHPEVIREIHQSYIKAGADIITTNTFQANELKLKYGSHSVEEVIKAGVEIAKSAGASYVALDIGPLGQLIQPLGKITFENAYDIFARQVKAGVEAGADLILIETMLDIYELKAAILAAKENSSLPVLATLTFQKDQKTLFGTDPATATLVLQALGVDALGVNCSLGPKEIIPVVEEILRYAKVPVMVQPNAGLPISVGGNITYDITSEQFAGYMKTMAEAGVTILGGCCGTTPEYISVTKKALEGISSILPSPQRLTSACSGRKTVIFGKGPIKLGILNQGPETIVSEAKKQQKEGGQVLRINIDYLGTDIGDLQKLIIKLQKTVYLPLLLEGSNLEALEGVVRAYNGKPILNFLQQKDKDLTKFFEIAKKYGTTVIAKSPEETLMAEKVGVHQEDILENLL